MMERIMEPEVEKELRQTEVRQDYYELYNLKKAVS